LKEIFQTKSGQVFVFPSSGTVAGNQPSPTNQDHPN
jgi:hypothetical protein